MQIEFIDGIAIISAGLVRRVFTNTEDVVEFVKEECRLNNLGREVKKIDPLTEELAERAAKSE